MPAGNWNIFSIWERYRGLLQRVNATNHLLQYPKLDLNAAEVITMLLKSFAQANREFFSDCERHRAGLSGTADYVKTRQQPRNVCFYYGPVSDAVRSPHTFRNLLISTLLYIFS